jgi:putative iron-dependent peroxidase
MNPQSAILDPIPPMRGTFLRTKPATDLARACARWRRMRRQLGRAGIGAGVAAALACLPGLRAFPSCRCQTGDSGDAAGAVVVAARRRASDLLLRDTLEALAAPAFTRVQAIDSFRHRDSRDLTGYEDGTENPKDEAAVAAAIAQGLGAGIDGSSFAAVQQWLHDFPTFDAMPRSEQDNSFGRRRDDNEELDDAPESAHVKRTAQEDFEPEAFVVRRSMPWTAGADAGLVFLAFGKSFDAYEAQLRRMTGHDDGISDALFSFTRPLTGGYYWCPPLGAAGVDLQALGL